MENRKTAGFIPAWALALLVAGCSSNSAPPPSTAAAAAPLAQAREKLAADVQACGTQYAYDPNHVTGVAENALAPHELEWRQCAYDAVRAYSRANPPLTGRYEQLIAEDIQMTTAIQQGQLTRTQRRARIQDLIAQVKAAEEQEIQAAAAQQEQQMDQLRNMVENFRGFSY